MGDVATDDGFNKYGFKDLKFSNGYGKIGNKTVKVSIYCPAKNENSESEITELFPKLNISEKVGDKWQNASFDLSDLEVLVQHFSMYKQALLDAGGATNGSDREQGSQEK